MIVMAEQFSKERRSLMRMLGARVVLTPKAHKGIGMVEKARELADLNGWFLCRQFETDSNWKYHERATGPEIMNDLGRINTKLDFFVSGYGTGGTFHGASKYIKSVSPSTKCILAEPVRFTLFFLLVCLFCGAAFHLHFTHKLNNTKHLSCCVFLSIVITTEKCGTRHKQITNPS